MYMMVYFQQREAQNESQEPVVLTTTNGGTSKGETGNNDEKAPIAVDDP